MDKDMPSGTSQDQIQNYIGTAGTQENVQNWISQREIPAMQGDINKGLFGHIRNWFNKSTGIWTIAELQSDVFQKMKADKLLADAIPKEEIDEYMNKNFWVKFNKEYSDKLVKDLNLQVISFKDIPSLKKENTKEIGKYERALETVKNNKEFDEITKELKRLDRINKGIEDLTTLGLVVFTFLGVPVGG
jgi:protein-tyrosine phosphatase